ncbi:MAG TPA: hypothetical protein VK574_07580 [Terracidiphilus sp.]|nr:hypothetical protein [Terracidiphilus sp.]
MKEYLKYGVFILIGYFVLRYVGGIFANVNGSIQSGTDFQPQYPGYPYGIVTLQPQSFVQSPASWRAPYRGGGWRARKGVAWVPGQ